MLKAASGICICFIISVEHHNKYLELFICFSVFHKLQVLSLLVLLRKSILKLGI